jgi:peptide/nickel transport system permease protein
MNSLSSIAWHKFLKDPLGVGGLLLILLTATIALSSYLWMPDQTPHANQMHLELATQKPGFEVEMLLLSKENAKAVSFIEQLLFGQPSLFKEIPISAWDAEGKRYRPFADGLALPWVPVNASDYLVEKRTFLLGTDKYGRDLWSRLLAGSRISLAVGFISVFISLLIGLSLGAAAGYFRGKVDDAIMWLVNVVWSIPTLLMVIAITLALGKGFWQVFVAVGLTMWVEVARVVRGQVMSVREKEYVEAGKALGFKHARIIFKHVLPNVMSAVIVISAANFASAILIEAGLSFLGIGAQPPMPSWGAMIKDHYAYIIMDKAYLAIAPGLAIMLLVLSFVLVGNALRDALDVRA